MDVIVEDQDSAVESSVDGRMVVYLGKTDQLGCTTVTLAAGTAVMGAAYEITHPTRGLWRTYGDADTPTWVASTSPALAQMLAGHYGCELREPGS